MAAAEIGSFPPGVKRFFLLGAPIIALIIYWILPNTYTAGRTHQKLSNEPRYRSPFIGDLTRGTF